jgi:hypothetical protein
MNLACEYILLLRYIAAATIQYYRMCEITLKYCCRGTHTVYTVNTDDIYNDGLWVDTLPAYLAVSKLTRRMSTT